GTELDPSDEQLVVEPRSREREESPDVRSPPRHAGEAYTQTRRHDGSESVEVPARRRVAAPHDLRAARGARPARTLEAHDGTPADGRVRGGMIVGRGHVVRGAAIATVRRAGVEGRV